MHKTAILRYVEIKQVLLNEVPRELRLKEPDTGAHYWKFADGQTTREVTANFVLLMIVGSSWHM